MDYFDITPQGLAALKQELADCHRKHPDYIKRVAAAAALGDRSENAEYTESKHDLRSLESRMRFLDKQIRYGQVVTVHDDDVVDLGKTVKISFSDDPGDEETYNVVGPAEAETAASNLTNVSPLGAALMKHHVGETITVQAPAGNYDVKIEAVTVTQ